MTRYIDADALYASIAKDTYLLTDESDSRDYGMFLIGIKQKIDEAPTANVIEVTDKSLESIIKGLEILADSEDHTDMVEVVRCADCDYRGDPIACPIDGNDLHHISDYDYCSWGERKEE